MVKQLILIIVVGIVSTTIGQASAGDTYVFPPMHDLRAGKMHLKLDDGRDVFNVCLSGRFHVKSILDMSITEFGGKFKGLVRAHPDVLAYYDKHKDAPYAGLSVWLKRNPDIFTVSFDHGFHELPMAYAVLAADQGDSLMVQAPGHEPVEFQFKRGRYWGGGMIPEESHNPYYRLVNQWGHSWKPLYAKKLSSPSKPVSAGPSDFIDHRKLSEELLRLRGKRRVQIRKWIKEKNAPKPETLKDGAEIMPIYFLGTVVDTKTAKPINQATIWLKRNPFIMSRTRVDGKYEIMMLQGTLYRKDDDQVLVQAPGYQPIEVPVKSYLNDNLTIRLKPIAKLETIDAYEEMVKIPAGFFRMGRGIVYSSRQIRIGASCEWGLQSADWPVRTVSLPSFYIMKKKIFGAKRDYETHQPLEHLLKWAKSHGYEFYPHVPNSWVNALLVCNALSEREGRTPCYYTPSLAVYRKGVCENPQVKWNANGYRLPTEAEWEYAAKAGNTTCFSYGNDTRVEDQYIFQRSEKKRLGIYNFGQVGQPKYRGLKKSNAFGLYDCEHPPAEWVWDIASMPTPEDVVNPKMRNRQQYQAERRYTSGGHFPLNIRYRGSGGWTFENIKWDIPVRIYQYGSAGHSWLDINWQYSTTGTGSFAGGLRLVISAENIDNKMNLKPKKDIKASLPKPLAKGKITADLKMMDIPAGEFLFGSSIRRFDAETRSAIMGSAFPEVRVKVSAFQLAQTETTYAQWKKVYDWAVKNDYQFENPGKMLQASSKDMTHPVNDISWLDAIMWCNAASEMQGLTPCYYTDASYSQPYRTSGGNDLIGDDLEEVSLDAISHEDICVKWDADGYRLPTEAQWEYAAQGGTDYAFYWGDWDDDDFAWFAGFPEQFAIQGKGGLRAVFMHPSGQKKGNQYGLYDMMGNVAEWCWDRLGSHAMIGAADKDAKAVKDDIKHLRKLRQVQATDYRGPEEGVSGVSFDDELSQAEEFSERMGFKNKAGNIFEGDYRILKGANAWTRAGFLHAFMGGAAMRMAGIPFTKSMEYGFRVARKVNHDKAKKNDKP